MPLKRIPVVALLVGTVVPTSVLVAGCGNSQRGGAAPTATAAASTTAAAPTTSPAATAAPSPTTTTLPADPQPDPLGAATVFIDGWKAGDRAKSASVAVPAAVTAIFSTPYAGQPLVNRQCTSEFLPRVCSFGPYGGGSGSLYQVDLLPDGPGWYVSDVQILG